MRLTRAIVSTGLVALVAHTSAEVASNCPQTGVCFKLNIPASTASSGSGDIFFQISAPSTYEWVSLGQGTRMSGSNMFLLYTSAGGNNVTLSPRKATGHKMPTYDSSVQATLLEGSGVSNGLMVANVKCSSCATWSGGSMDFKAASGEWIYAYKPSDGPKNTNDQSAPIGIHTEHESFVWDFSAAKGGNSVNPLVNAVPASNGASSTSTSTEGGDSEKDKHVLIAHGVLAAFAFVILFPSGSMAIRLASFPGMVWIHAACQVFAYIVYAAAFGLGIHLASKFSLFHYHHPIIGLVVFALIFFQPISGFLHHMTFKKYGRRTLTSYGHIWLGRIAITLGIINGGLGLHMADQYGLSSKPGIIVYGVVAGLVWVVWVGVDVWGESRRKQAVSEKLSPRVGSEEGSR